MRHFAVFRVVQKVGFGSAMTVQRIHKRISAIWTLERKREKKDTFYLSGRAGLPLLDLTPEMHSNTMLDLWETSKSFGIDPVVASGGRFDCYSQK